MTPQSALVWTCIALFAATGLITLLALLGVVALGPKKASGNRPRHDYYLKRLFAALVIELIGVSLAAYSAYFGLDDQVAGLKAMINGGTIEGEVAASSTEPIGEVAEHTPPVEEPRPPRTQTLSTEVYVSSDGPRNQTETITIPAGWRYVSHDLRGKTGNENYTRDVKKILGPDGKTVTAVTLSASAAGKKFLGPRSWFGGVLTVEIEEIRN